MLKDVGMTVPKIKETRQYTFICSNTIITCVTLPTSFSFGLYVACPHPLCCCIYAALVSLILGTVISNILLFYTVLCIFPSAGYQEIENIMNALYFLKLESCSYKYMYILRHAVDIAVNGMYFLFLKFCS